jgi:hypothetical protein
MDIKDKKIEPGEFIYYLFDTPQSVVDLVNTIISDIKFTNKKKDSKIIRDRILKLPINEQLYVINYLFDSDINLNPSSKRELIFEMVFFKKRIFKLHFKLLIYLSNIFSTFEQDEISKYEKLFNISINTSYIKV